MTAEKFDRIGDPNKQDFEDGRESYFYPRLFSAAGRTGRALDAFNAGRALSEKCDEQYIDETQWD